MENVTETAAADVTNPMPEAERYIPEAKRRAAEATAR